MCPVQIVVVVNIEIRQLGNGIDSVVNATWEVSENFISQWRGRRKIYRCFIEIKRKIWLNILCQIYTFPNGNYGSVKGTPLICKVLEHSSQQGSNYGEKGC